MANSTYKIDQLATGTATVTVTDDGNGSDWLVMTGTYAEPTDIRLGWTVESGAATSASGFYFSDDGVGHRLVVNGQIENVKGTNTTDFIAGNELANILYGDNTSGGVGGDDTISGGEGKDTIYGGAGNDTLGGDGGNDTLQGDAGDDTISGGSGRDTIQGGKGADSLDGGADADDTVSYAASQAGVRLTITHGATTSGFGGEAAGDRLFGFTDVIGSGFDDQITDTVQNTIAFGYNDNSFYGGNGNDKLTLGGGADLGAGGAGNDTILGGEGKDTLTGDANNDTLTGGNGADVQTGGSGGDIFVFASRTDSRVALADQDQITDFDRAERDKIDLSALDADTAVTGNQSFRFIGTGAFTGVLGQLRYQVTNGDATVSGDVNGDKKADFAILLSDITSLAAGDFFL